MEYLKATAPVAPHPSPEDMVRGWNDLETYWRRHGLSGRACWVLARAGLKTAEEIRALGSWGLLALENCGRVTVAEIEKLVLGGSWSYPAAAKPPDPAPQLRLECLRLALEHQPHPDGDAISAAERYWRFVSAAE